MKHTTGPLFTSILFCLFIGCSADQSNPVVPVESPISAKSSGIIADTAISWAGSIIADPCSDEVLLCSGSMKFRFQIIPDGSGGWHIISSMMSEKFVATNQNTGTTYRVSE